MDRRLKCISCGWSGPEHQFVGLDLVERLNERLTPGYEVPGGECPSCGALAYVVKTNNFMEQSRRLSSGSMEHPVGRVVGSTILCGKRVKDKKGSANMVGTVVAISYSPHREWDILVASVLTGEVRRRHFEEIILLKPEEL